MQRPFSDTRRKLLKAGALSLAAPFYSFTIYHPRKVVGPEVGHGDFRYRVDKTWGDQDPARIPVKDCHEMIQDSRGRLLMLTNDTHNNVLIYDRSGKVLETWGHDFPGAHGLTLTREGGEEFLFITCNSRHQVFKTTLDGRILMTLDYPAETGVYAKAEEYVPTEVAVAPNGDFYVADGYGKNYIMQYDYSGKLIRFWGGKGEADDEFDCCHGVRVDLRKPEAPTLLITSRSQQSFKRFSLDGKYLSTTHLPGCWICRPVLKGENLYFAVIVTETWDSYDGCLAVLDGDDKVLSLPGANEPVYRQGVLQAPASDKSTFLNPHDICVDADENLYIPQWNSKQTYPVRLERI